jgi:hypothetical protein
MVLCGETTMLTDTKIRALKPADKPYKLGDAHQLYLLITPAGGKLWRMNYRFGGKQRALSFGAYRTTSWCSHALGTHISR